MSELTQNSLKEILSYNENTGVFTWLKSSSRTKAGANAGCLDKYGYMRIGINKKIYRLHRLAWLYMTGNWPNVYIDHIDGNKSNNIFSNLREATDGENKQNKTTAQERNRSGFLGVSIVKATGKFKASIGINGSNVTIGIYDAPEKAHEAYIEAKRIHHPFNTL